LENRAQFATRWGFAFAAIGSAVGLGNIWRFPFMAGENGGGAFISLYFIFILLFGIPALIAMILIGRRGGKSPVGSTESLAIASGHSRNWKWLGWLTLSVAFFALTFFSVVAGWVLAYLVKSIFGELVQLSPAESVDLFNLVKSDPLGMAFWHGVFMVLTMSIVGRGVRAGVERAVSLMMPALFVILLFLVAHAALTADFYSAAQFMFVPDFDRLDSQVVLLALGQAFFSLSVGGGGIIAYGAYLQREASIPKTAVLIASANVSVDLLAGLAIFPIVFSYGLQAGAGPGLLFEALPVAFGQMPGGQIIGSLFFVLVLFAALSTSISMLESVVSRLVERPGATRASMTLIAGSLIWLIGLGSVFSYNLLADFEPLGFITMFEGFTIFRLVDFFVVNVLILASALLLTIFVGYVMSRQATQEEWGLGNHVLFRLWRFNMRYIAPPVILLIFVVTMAGQ